MDEAILGIVESTLRAIEHSCHEFGVFGSGGVSASFGASVETPKPGSSSSAGSGSSLTSGCGSGSGSGAGSSLSLFLFL